MENSSDFEVWSMFTDEIEQWYEEAGGDFTKCDYVGKYDPETTSLTAKLVVFSEDADEVVEELNKTKTEFLAHLITMFPQTKISVTAVTPSGWQESENSPVVEDRTYSTIEDLLQDELGDDDDAVCLDFDEDDDIDVDSQDIQYEEEGLTLVDGDIDGEEDFTDIIKEEEQAVEDEDDAEFGGVSSRDLADLDVDYADDYVPDDKDREELWRSFWVSEDE